MHRSTALALTGLLALLLGSASPAQDEAAEMKWAYQDGDKFDLKWSYQETRRREPGRGDVAETHDKRDVEAELSFKSEGTLLLTLKKVVWSYGSQDYEVTLLYLEGRKLEPQMKMKIGPSVSGYPVSKGDADRMVDYMKKLTEGEFSVNTGDEKGRTNFLWNGGSVRGGGTSLFDRIFTHPLLPSGPVRVGQIFKDPLDVTNLPAGLADIKDVESKVTAVGDKGLIAKGGLSVPVAKTITANNQAQTMSGNFTYSCEWNYSPQQYLQGSREESKFTKKVDAKGKDADFYRENFNHTVAQVLTIKKKGPKPGDEKKPADAKPDEKKPGEKK